MGRDQEWDPGHGEPDHVHDENWKRHSLEGDDLIAPDEDRPTVGTDEESEAPDVVPVTDR